MSCLLKIMKCYRLTNLLASPWASEREKRGICPATHQCKQRLFFQQRRNEDAKGCSTAAVRTDTLRHWYDTNTQKWEVVLWETAQSRHDAIHPRLSTVPNLTWSDVIGDGGFVYHIWRGSDTASLGIGRERPSFTKSLAFWNFTNKARAHGICSPKQTLSEIPAVWG